MRFLVTSKGEGGENSQRKEEDDQSLNGKESSRLWSQKSSSSLLNSSWSHGGQLHMPNHLFHPPTLLILIRAASYHIPLQPPCMLWFWGFFLFCLGLLRASHRFLTSTQTLVCGSGESRPQKSPRRRGNAGHMFLWGHSAKISIQLLKTFQVVIWKDVKTVYRKKKKLHCAGFCYVK